jgi:hypothetical protein
MSELVVGRITELSSRVAKLNTMLKAAQTSIEMNIPLFIRVLEFAREDMPRSEEGDLWIHRLTEMAASMSGCLDMADYEKLTKAAKG